MTAVLTGALVVCFAAAARADLVDDFNRDALNPDSNAPVWIGGSYGPTNGHIVVDPLDSTNHVLAFTATRAGGDAFTAATFTLDANQSYALSFRYLGSASSVTGYSSGGYIGVYESTTDRHNWIAGTYTNPSEIRDYGLILGFEDTATQRLLVDDGVWHSYSFMFRSASAVTVRIMTEDFLPPSGNGYFDDIGIAAVPLPASASVGLALLSSLGALGWLRRRRERSLAI